MIPVPSSIRCWRWSSPKVRSTCIAELKLKHLANMFLCSLFLIFLVGITVFAFPTRPSIPQGSLQQVNNSGIFNPTDVGFFVYVPVHLAERPGVITAIHYCTGSAQAYYEGSPYAQLAEQYGFIVVYPSSPYDGTCWDVSSPMALTHNGGGDSNSIANMVTWIIEKYHADPSMVFVTGSSSGAMMTVRKMRKSGTLEADRRDRTSWPPRIPSSSKQQRSIRGLPPAASCRIQELSMHGTPAVPKASLTTRLRPGPRSFSRCTQTTMGLVLGCRYIMAPSMRFCYRRTTTRRSRNGQGCLGTTGWSR